MGMQEGTLKDRCSVFTSAWDRKSQLCCICAALPVTNSEIQPEIKICHFHTGSKPLNCITILILLYYFDILLLLLL